MRLMMANHFLGSFSVSLQEVRLDRPSRRTPFPLSDFGSGGLVSSGLALSVMVLRHTSASLRLVGKDANCCKERGPSA